MYQSPSLETMLLAEGSLSEEEDTMSSLHKITRLVTILSILENMQAALLTHNSGLCQDVQSVNALLS